MERARAKTLPRRLEGFALGLLAALPLLPYLIRFAQKPLPRFTVDGDYAGLELATQFVSTGRTLLGPYSRFQFNHPGPLYFFLLKPFHALCGSTTTGMFVGACVLNMLSAFTVVFAARVFAKRAHAFAALLVVLAWFAAFRQVLAHPWNPAVIALPVLAFLILASFFARGHAKAAPAAALFGMFVTQTHVATLPTVVVVSVAALVAFIRKSRREEARLSRSDKRWLGGTAGVIVVTMILPIIEQLTAREGNFTKLAKFFAHPPEPSKPLGSAFAHFGSAIPWLPTRLAGEEATQVLSSVEQGTNGIPWSAFAVWIACVVAGGLVARKTKDEASLAFLATSVVATVMGVLSLRGVVGSIMPYLLFWTTAVTSLTWIGLFSAIANAAGERPRVGTAGGALAIVAALASTSVQNKHLSDHTIGYERPHEPLRIVYGALVERMRATNATPVLHPDGAWHIALSFANELTRDGLDARVEEKDRWLLGRQLRTPTGAGEVFHVYTQAVNHPLRNKACLERLAVADDLEVWVSPKEVSSCD